MNTQDIFKAIEPAKTESICDGLITIIQETNNNRNNLAGFPIKIKLTLLKSEMYSWVAWFVIQAAHFKQLC